MKDKMLKDFILVGGTALALKLGHRLSVDIDLFTTRDFDSSALIHHLQKEYEATNEIVFENTIMTYINDIKVDLLAHKYPVIAMDKISENIRMISNDDIGAMKLHAIFQSGERLKDFVDMYFLLEEKPLQSYLNSYQIKYNGNPYLSARSLIYFDGIRKEYDVSMVHGKENKWKRMQERLKKAVLNPNLKFGNSAEKKVVLKNKGKGVRR
ncbi:nucleotidyl transferase AbiEii/AbiGii toxin family protein [Chryseobacterium sp. G0186]|uniref:nucleotidyl transferase AbiEii/AbiGii toxin family protein n=1 Tax=Chryseobacterium sp. G0186 TaxID=2487064 RepID=UPI001E3B55C2|nr:nucleotidyl transferase AbiEii/AbiGii toxin family protein [Chryseobacterium sp. G0186]